MISKQSCPRPAVIASDVLAHGPTQLLKTLRKRREAVF